MSIVLNVMNDKNSWLMSDGLQRAADTGKVVSENLPKFEQLHPRLAIGYTGTYEAALDVVRNLKMLSKGEAPLNVEQAANLITKILAEAARQGIELKAQFVLTGISQSGLISSCTLCAAQPCTMYIPNGSIRTVMLHNRSKEDLTLAVRQSLAFYPGNEDIAIRMAMRGVINRTAQYDTSVNTQIFETRIFL